MLLNLRSLEALRGFLALYVLLGHARWLLWCGFSRWNTEPHSLLAKAFCYPCGLLRYGHEAVLVFFVLSGFFIHLRMSRKSACGEGISLDVATYGKRRVHRLLAPYVLALGITVLCDFAGLSFFPELYAARTGDELLDSNFSKSGYGWAATVPTGIMLPGAFGKHFGSNGPLWSLAFEVVYYALYPLWLLTRKRSTWLAFAVVPAVFIASRALPFSWLTGVASHYPLWLAGAGLAEIMARGWVKTGYRFVVPVAAGAGFALYQWAESPLPKFLGATVFGCGIVLWSATLPASLTRHRWHRICEFLGVRGYTIYICHFPILVLISAATIHYSGVRPLDGFLAVVGSLTTLGICCLLFELCEKHFLHARIQLRDHQPHGFDATVSQPVEKAA